MLYKWLTLTILKINNLKKSIIDRDNKFCRLTLTDSGNVGILCIEHKHVDSNLLSRTVERQLLVEICHW